MLGFPWIYNYLRFRPNDVWKNLVSIKIVATFTSKPDYSDNSILEFAEDICYSWMVGKDSDVIMRSAANESCSLNVRWDKIFIVLKIDK